MVRFDKNMMNDGTERMQKFIKEQKRLPNTLSMTDMDGKHHTLKKAQYAGLYEAQNVFYLKNGRQPNYTTLNSTANNPLVMDYQNDSVSCGPASLAMAIQMLYDFVGEKTCKSKCGTGSNGTAPADLIAGAKKLGYQLSKINRNSTSVKAQLQMGRPVIAHIDTKPANCLGYINNYGHYVLIYDTTGTSYKVADPTKGLKTCKFSILDKAMLGRTIGYYSVAPL